MTVIDRLRAVTADEQGDHRPELVAALHGAAAAAATWALVTVLVVLGAATAERSTASLGDLLGAGSAVWLALGGARLGLGAATLALTPLLGLALLVLTARWGARRALADVPDDADADADGSRDADLPDEHPAVARARRLARSPFVRRAGAWVGGYALVAFLAWALSLAGPLDVPVPSVLLPAVLVPVLGVLLSGHVALDAIGEALPTALRRGLAPGLRGALRLLATGAALVILMVVVHLGRVMHVHGALDAGLAGGLLLAVLQLLALPNLGLWAVSWLAGSGFTVSLGAETTWAESQTSLLPMIPALAAHPDPGSFPWVTRLVVLLPVLLGAWLARDTLARVPRLSRTSVKASAVACAVAVSAVALGVLDALGGGSLGTDRLADLGVPALSLVVALVLTTGLGAAAVLAHDWWRQRR